MTVSREEVVWAYRMFLGREPESEAVIEATLAATDVGHLRNVFLGSEEFAKKFGKPVAAPLTVGRFIDVNRSDIDIASTPAELQQMFDRIAAAWRRFGETEPHWSVIVSDDFRQENLAANIDAFYASGTSDVSIYLNFLRRAGLPIRFGKALDFGCGVGRLTLALAPYADSTMGVDLSPPHLRLAAERAQLVDADSVAFEAIGTVDDLDRYRGFDIVISCIVLQHNPPPVMAALYRKLLDTLAPGGVAVVQMPTYIRGQTFSVVDYLANEQPSMEMNGLPQKIIFEIIEQAGCRVLEVREDWPVGEIGLSHCFAVMKT